MGIWWFSGLFWASCETDKWFSLPSCSCRASQRGIQECLSHTWLGRKNMFMDLRGWKHKNGFELFEAIKTGCFFLPTATKSFFRFPDISLSILSCRVFLLMFLYSTTAGKTKWSSLVSSYNIHKIWLIIHFILLIRDFLWHSVSNWTPQNCLNISSEL